MVAEGVETPEQVDFLKRRGCDEVQGFLFSKPVHGGCRAHCRPRSNGQSFFAEMILTGVSGTFCIMLRLPVGT